MGSDVSLNLGPYFNPAAGLDQEQKEAFAKELVNFLQRVFNLNTLHEVFRNTVEAMYWFGADSYNFQYFYRNTEKWANDLTGFNPATSDPLAAFVLGAAIDIGLGCILGNLIAATKTGTGGVYDLTTSSGKYVGQSKNFIQRITQHFSKNGKLTGQTLMDDVYNAMPGSTKLEREVYEQFLINKYGGPSNMINKVNPMGGRMDTFYNMIDDVITKYNLPK